MPDSKKRLGRGLDSLLSSTRLQELEELAGAKKDIAQSPITKEISSEHIAELPINKIYRNPHQPRQEWNEAKLYELAESIKINGLIQPILVRMMGDGYQLIAGERRLRAMKMAGKQKISAIIRQASEEQMVEWALIENIHRTDLNPIERASAYYHYINSFSLNQQEAAERLGEDRSTIANYLRLMELPEEIKKLLAEEKLSMGHARALLGVKDIVEQMKQAEKTVNQNLSVRELERRVQKIRSDSKNKYDEKREKSANVIEMEQELTRTIGTKVTIQTAGKKEHRGRIIIEYYSLDDFDRIREKLL